MVVPALAYGTAVRVPVVGVRLMSGPPTAAQLLLEFFIPIAVPFAIVKSRAIAETKRTFVFVEVGNITRGDALLAGGLSGGIGDILIEVFLFSSKIVLGLFPVPSKRRFDTIPGGII